jgi:hypothetical protein
MDVRSQVTDSRAWNLPPIDNFFLICWMSNLIARAVVGPPVRWSVIGTKTYNELVESVISTASVPRNSQHPGAQIEKTCRIACLVSHGRTRHWNEWWWQTEIDPTISGTTAWQFQDKQKSCQDSYCGESHLGFWMNPVIKLIWTIRTVSESIENELCVFFPGNHFATLTNKRGGDISSGHWWIR